MTLENKKAYPEVCFRILESLKKRLSSKLTYHSVQHTVDVANVCNAYILHYDLSKDIGDLIRIAAIAHDFGYIKSPINHEENSILLLRPYISDLYSKKEMKIINGLIRATKVPQNPKSLYEEILADADLDYLGREDYDLWSEKLYKEFVHFGVVSSAKEWIDMQIQFLENHSYHTPLAIEKRKGSKEAKIIELKKKSQDSALDN